MQEIDDARDHATRAGGRTDVSAFAVHLEHGLRNRLMHPECDAGRNQRILLPPDNQNRCVNLAKLPIEQVFAA